MIELPKYVEKALKDRSKYLAKALRAGRIVDDYAIKKLGIIPGSEEYNNACIESDIRIFCETDFSESTTRKVLKSVLNKRCGIGEKNERDSNI